MKKLLPLLTIACALTFTAQAQDKMNKKMENKTDKMNKKMENTTDKMNKKLENASDTVDTKTDSSGRKATPKARKRKA